MVDRQISACCVLAYGLWAASLGLWGLAWVIDSPEVGRLSIIVCAAGATATVRCYFIEQHARFKTALAVISTVPIDPVTRIR